MSNFNARIDFSELERNLKAVGVRAGRGSKRAVLEGCTHILNESLEEVPEATGTLSSSAFIRVTRIFGAGFTGQVGYGGNGDPVNPNTGQQASQYMVAVHEDLGAKHVKGKAKFLEDPVRRYNFLEESGAIIWNEIAGGK